MSQPSSQREAISNVKTPLAHPVPAIFLLKIVARLMILCNVSLIYDVPALKKPTKFTFRPQKYTLQALENIVKHLLEKNQNKYI